MRRRPPLTGPDIGTRSPVASDPSTEAVAARFLEARRGRPMAAGPPSLARLLARHVQTKTNPKERGAAGIGIASLAARWTEIVGPRLAEVSRPDALRGEVLTLRVLPSAAPILAMRQTEILGHVRLAGLATVSRLKLVQAPLNRPGRGDSGGAAPAARVRPLDAAEVEALEVELERVGDRKLRAALRRLAKGVAGLDR